MNRLARAIYANTRKMMGFEPLNFSAEYQRVRRRRFPGSPDFVEFNGYTDPRLQAILELHRERAICQNIDRLRPLFKEAAERRIRWFILCKLPLPGIVPDRLDTLSNILAGGSRMERAFIGGLVTTNAVGMSGAHRHLYPMPNDARVDIQKEKLAQALEEQAKATSANKEDSIWGNCLFDKIKDLAPLHVPGRFRVVTGPVPPKWSLISAAPSRFRRTDLSILNATEAPAMSRVEFDGDITVTVTIAQRQDTAADRIADLTRLDAVPTPEEGVAFREAVLEFFAALDADARVPGPDWWTKPPLAGGLSSLPPVERPVPAGRWFSVTYRTVSGVEETLYWFPDVVGGAFLDQCLRPYEPTADLRWCVEEIEPPISAEDAAAAAQREAIIDAAFAKADAELAAAAKKAGPL
jgi:hypothetical protein